MTEGKGACIAQAATALIGTPFRLYGRDRSTGVDCVGLVLLALRAAGIPVAEPPPYRLRQIAFDIPARLIARARLLPVDGPALPGDLLLVRPGPAQLHLLIQGAPAEAIHAHAGLGRVVATPLPLPWPAERHWRITEQG